MSILFEDIFEVRQLNKGGKKYDKINRLTCKGSVKTHHGATATVPLPPILLPYPSTRNHRRRAFGLQALRTTWI